MYTTFFIHRLIFRFTPLHRYPTLRCILTAWRRTATRCPSTRKAHHIGPIMISRKRTCGPDLRICWPIAGGTLLCERPTRWTTRSSSQIIFRIRETCKPWWKAYGSCFGWWVPVPWASGTCGRTGRRIRLASTTGTAPTRIGRAWWSPTPSPRTIIRARARWARRGTRRRWSIPSSECLACPIYGWWTRPYSLQDPTATPSRPSSWWLRKGRTW